MEFFSPGHIVIFAIVCAVLYFSRGQLPDMAKSAGRSLRVFRTEMKGLAEDVRGGADDAQTTDGAPTSAQRHPMDRAEVITNVTKTPPVQPSTPTTPPVSRPAPRPSPAGRRTD